MKESVGATTSKHQFIYELHKWCDVHCILSSLYLMNCSFGGVSGSYVYTILYVQFIRTWCLCNSSTHPTLPSHSSSHHTCFMLYRRTTIWYFFLKVCMLRSRRPGTVNECSASFTFFRYSGLVWFMYGHSWIISWFLSTCKCSDEKLPSLSNSVSVHPSYSI